MTYVLYANEACQICTYYHLRSSLACYVGLPITVLANGTSDAAPCGSAPCGSAPCDFCAVRRLAADRFLTESLTQQKIQSARKKYCGLRCAVGAVRICAVRIVTLFFRNKISCGNLAAVEKLLSAALTSAPCAVRISHGDYKLGITRVRSPPSNSRRLEQIATCFCIRHGCLRSLSHGWKSMTGVIA